MEKGNGDRPETIVTEGINTTVVGESSANDGEIGENRADARRIRSRRIRLVRRRKRKQQRDGESRDSDDTRDASANAGADAANADETEFDEENYIRVNQYASESRKTRSRKKESAPKKPIKIEDAIEQFLDTAFSVVSLLSGEAHWALEPAEREMLTDAVVAYIEAQDRRTLQRLKKAAGKYFPAINLAVVSFAIVYPRLLQSKLFLKNKV
jgi:hypothetical protein